VGNIVNPTTIGMLMSSFGNKIVFTADQPSSYNVQKGVKMMNSVIRLAVDRGYEAW
jgi:hypothetical protein